MPNRSMRAAQLALASPAKTRLHRIGRHQQSLCSEGCSVSSFQLFLLNYPGHIEHQGNRTAKSSQYDQSSTDTQHGRQKPDQGSDANNGDRNQQRFHFHIFVRSRQNLAIGRDDVCCMLPPCLLCLAARKHRRARPSQREVQRCLPTRSIPGLPFEG